MWIARGDRKAFLDLMSSSEFEKIPELHLTDRIDYTKSGGVLFVWDKKPGTGPFRVPDVIGVPDGQIRDFLAWTSTYIPSFCPLTAYCRVFEASLLELATESPLPVVSNRVENAVLGTIMGELVTHAENNDIRAFTPIAVRSMISFALSRAIFIGYGPKAVQQIYKRWSDARKCSLQKMRMFSADLFNGIWDVVLSLIFPNDYQVIGSLNVNLKNIRDICKSIISDDKDIDPGLWALTGDAGLKFGYHKLMVDNRASREEKVRWFEEEVETIASLPSLDFQVRSFLCAYFAYLIAPGQSDFTHLLSPFLVRFPDVIIWYHLLSGLDRNSDVRGQRGGLGWRILRDLVESETLYDRPRTDLSVDELMMLTEADYPQTEFWIDNPSYLDVEILPMVSVTIHSFSKHGQLDLFQEDSYRQKQAAALRKLGQSITKTKELYDSLSKLTSLQGTGRTIPPKK